MRDLGQSKLGSAVSGNPLQVNSPPPTFLKQSNLSTFRKTALVQAAQTVVDCSLIVKVVVDA